MLDFQFCRTCVLGYIHEVFSFWRANDFVPAILDKCCGLGVWGFVGSEGVSGLAPVVEGGRPLSSHYQHGSQKGQ